MTWIVKASSGYEYLAAPGEGSAWGPDLSDAFRFSTKRQAERERRRSEREGEPGTTFRVVRLRRSGDRLRDAARAVWDAAKLVKDRPSLHTVPTRLLRDLDRALPIRAARSGGSDR